MCSTGCSIDSILWVHRVLNSHMYQHFISRHFSKQAGIIVFVNRPRAHCGVLRLIEASFLRPDSPRMSQRSETVKLSRRQMTVQCNGRHEHRDQPGGTHGNV